jgi:hypothetical protein
MHIGLCYKPATFQRTMNYIIRDVTDECYEIGTVLAQIWDGDEKQIAFASRQLKPLERKYATVEEEDLTLVN